MHRIVLCGIGALAVLTVATAGPGKPVVVDRQADPVRIVCRGRTATADAGQAAGPQAAADVGTNAKTRWLLSEQSQNGTAKLPAATALASRHGTRC